MGGFWGRFWHSKLVQSGPAWHLTDIAETFKNHWFFKGLGGWGMPGWHQNNVLEAPRKHLQHLGRYLEAPGPYSKAPGMQRCWPGGSEFKGTGSVEGKWWVWGPTKQYGQKAAKHQGINVSQSHGTFSPSNDSSQPGGPQGDRRIYEGLTRLPSPILLSPDPLSYR